MELCSLKWLCSVLRGKVRRGKLNVCLTECWNRSRGCCISAQVISGLTELCIPASLLCILYTAVLALAALSQRWLHCYLYLLCPVLIPALSQPSLCPAPAWAQWRLQNELVLNALLVDGRVLIGKLDSITWWWIQTVLASLRHRLQEMETSPDFFLIEEFPNRFCVSK